MKPAWRLNPDAPLREEREALKSVKAFGPCAAPHLGDNLLSVQRWPSNFHVFTTKDSLHEPNIPQAAEVPALEAASEADKSKPQDLPPRQSTSEVKEEAESWQKSPTSSPNQSQSEWSQRHHITWCNERNTQGPKLNPVQTRCYFDRHRNPHNSRCEHRSYARGEDVKPMRVLPHWRLRTDPLTGTDMRETQMSAGSDTSNHALEALKAPTRSHSSKHNDAREQRWDSRHEIVFKNEEVSRLDRCYFDRWKEPEATLQNERTVRSLKPTWSLARDGSPEKTAEKLLSKSAVRNSNWGQWDYRHQRLFPNDIHSNLKSYFDRPRKPEDMTASRQRKKVTDKDKLKVESWSLQVSREYQVKVDFSKVLRSESAPALPTAGSQSKKAPLVWFSSHGVIF